MCKEFYCPKIFYQIFSKFNNITNFFRKKLYPLSFFKNEPGLVLNLFLIFGKKPGSSSYKLGSYKKKRV